MEKGLIMKIENLIVEAESIQTGERLIGYVCGCKSCATAYSHSRLSTVQ